MGKMRWLGALAACAGLLLWGSSLPVDAQGQQVLVIQGGTLIDGNGGAPLANSVIVVQGDRITAVGAAGQVQIPAGAEVIDASGKWVLPGLMDAKSNWYWQYAEPALFWGVTTAFSSGGRNDLGSATRDAINHGVFPGSRLFQTFVAIRGRGPDGARRDSYVPGQGNKFVATPEEVVQWVNNAIEGGADFITFGDGNGPVEMWAAGIAEAERYNKAIVFRAMGPQTRAREVCEMGDGIVMVHTGNVGAQIATDEEKWASYIGLPPDAYSDMDEAKMHTMIEHLVGCNAYIEPDLMAADRGFHRNWARVQQENREFLNDPNLAAYYPQQSYVGVIENSKSPETYLDPDELEIRRQGFLNHVRFLKAYVDAGGKIVPASDNPQTHPGLGLHQEITAFVEDVGLTPMQAILSATLWTAEGYKVDGDLGTVEEGKLADIIVLNANPLQNILNLREIDTVIKNGDVIDRTYNPDFVGGMFGNNDLSDNWAVIGDAGWMRALKNATWQPNARNGRFAAVGGIDSEKALTPGIEAITPYTLIRGTGDTDMRITGFHFVTGSQAYIRDQAIPTAVDSRTEIRVTIPASVLAEAGKHPITIKNPEPLVNPRWGDTSNPAYVLVPFEFTTAYSHNRF